MARTATPGKEYPYHIDDGSTVFGVPERNGRFTVFGITEVFAMIRFLNASPRVVEGSVSFEDGRRSQRHATWDVGA